jgi:hypothetical protein
MRRESASFHGDVACKPEARTPPALFYLSVAYAIDSPGSGQALAAVSWLRRRKAAE